MFKVQYHFDPMGADLVKKSKLDFLPTIGTSMLFTDKNGDGCSHRVQDVCYHAELKLFYIHFYDTDATDQLEDEFRGYGFKPNF